MIKYLTKNKTTIKTFTINNVGPLCLILVCVVRGSQIDNASMQINSY